MKKLALLLLALAALTAPGWAEPISDIIDITNIPEAEVYTLEVSQGESKDMTFTVDPDEFDSFPISDQLGKLKWRIRTVEENNWIRGEQSSDKVTYTVTASPTTAVPPSDYPVSIDLYVENLDVGASDETLLTATLNVKVNIAKDTTIFGETLKVDTTSDDKGSHTKTQTIFREPWDDGRIIASMDITITTEAETLSGTAGLPFSTDVGVSVDIKVSEKYGYQEYALSLDVSDLPDGLKVEGGTLFKNISLASRNFTLKLTGTPKSAGNAAVTIAATVTLSGDQLPTLVASADKTVYIVGKEPFITALSVNITGNTPGTPLTVEQGKTLDLGANVNVQAQYNNKPEEWQDITSGYNLEWEPNGSLPKGFSLSKEGKLTVGTDAEAATSPVSVQVTATTTDGRNVTSPLATANIYVTVQHTHSFTYTASGATITATCTAEGCPLTAKPTLTLVAPKDLVYDGKPKAATVNGSIPGVTTPPVTYKQGSTTLSDAPVNGGNYTASITLGGATASVNFTIKREDTLNNIAVSIEFTNPLKKDNPVLNVFKNTTDELEFSAVVTAFYSDGTSDPVPDAALSFSFGDGTPAWVVNASDLNAHVLRANPPVDIANGTYAVELKVRAAFNGKTGTATRSLNVNVERGTNGIPARLDIGTEYTSLPAATMERYYSAKISAYGTAPLKWELADSKLPLGLRLNPNTGEISGTPEKTGESSFYVKVTNFYSDKVAAYGLALQEYTLRVVDELPGNWDDEIYGEYVQKEEGRRKIQIKVKKNRTFNLKMWALRGTNVYYTVRTKPQETFTTTIYNSPHRGAGYVDFKLRYRDRDQTYTARVTADNSSGHNETDKSVSITKRDSTYGEITQKTILAAAVSSEPGVGVILAGNESENGGSSVTYHHDGGMDEDGNITAVIDGAGSGDYAYDSLDTMLNALKDEEKARVTRLEFRKGASLASLSGDSLSGLTGLLDLTIDDGSALTALDLSGNKVIESVSLFNCAALASLNVSSCAALKTLSVVKCPQLKNLRIDGCSELVNLSMIETGLTELRVGSFTNLVNLNVNVCEDLKALDVSGCAALETLRAGYTAITVLDTSKLTNLTDVFLNSTGITELDLSQCTNLRSLSLGNTMALKNLKLPPDVELEYSDLDGSGIAQNEPDNPNPDAPTSDKDGGGCDGLPGGLALLAIIPALARKRM